MITTFHTPATKVVLDTRPDYGMFSAKGNELIHGIVLWAIGTVKNGISAVEVDSYVEDALCVIAKDRAFEEATDTDVREQTFNAINKEISK